MNVPTLIRGVAPTLAMLSLSSFAALAQPAPSPSPHPLRLVKLPSGDYTIPLSELEASGTSGKVTLHPQGLKTLVTVYAFGQHKHRAYLRSGSDCVATSVAGGIPLRPALSGQPSRTIVSVPIGDLTSKNYLVDVRDATERTQAEQACARL